MEINISKQSTVATIFSNLLKEGEETYQFSIPIYQREYSWREKQWEEIFKDLLHSFKNTNMDTDYWGNVIVYKKDSAKELEIVDGQQRIITLLMLIISLGNSDTVTVDGYLPLKFHDETNESVWQKIAFSYKMSQDEKRHCFNQLVQFFKKQIIDRNIDSQALLNHLMNTQISVVVVDDELESNLLFGRLNTRGLPLNDVDLIKHRIFYATERRLPPTGNDIVLEKWKQLSNVTQNLNTTIEVFLSQWWEAHYDLSGKSLYESFQDEIEVSKYLRFLDSILTTSNKVLSLRENNTGSDNKIGRNLKWLLKISGSDQLWLVLTAIEETTFGREAKIRLYELLTVFEFVRSIFPERDFSKLEEAYQNFGKNLLSEVAGNRMTEREILTEITKLRQSMSELLPDLDDFINQFTKLRFDDQNHWKGSQHEKMLSTYAIYTLNNWLDVVNHGAGAEFRTKDDDDYSVEHIRSKSNATVGKDSVEYLIGNLVVFEKQPNNDLGEAEVSDKLSAYRKSNYPQIQELLYKNNRNHTNNYRENRLMEWDVSTFESDDIQARGRYLANSFYERVIDLLEDKETN